MKNKKLAFTLAEVLIAITVIGAVSALVIPQVLMGQKAAQARSQFNTAYSILAASIAKMDADNVSVKPITYHSDPKILYNILKKYNKVSHDCGQGSDSLTDYNSEFLCEPNPDYTGLRTCEVAGSFILNNGMLVIVEYDPNGISCSSDILYNNIDKYPIFMPAAYADEISLYIETREAVVVSIDINGNNKKPNKRGYDVFTFQLIDGDIVPVGSEKSFTHETCNLNSTSKETLMACTQAAATDEDYFKKLYNNR